MAARSPKPLPPLFHRCVSSAPISARPERALTIHLLGKAILMKRSVSVKVAAVAAILALGGVGLAHDALARGGGGGGGGGEAGVAA
jgi:hypothetical protein